MRNWKEFSLLWLICLLLLYGCPAQQPQSQAPQTQPPQIPQPLEQPIFKKISAAEIPDLQDDEPAETLRSAILQSLRWYKRISDEKPVSFGNQSIPAKVMRESLVHFLSLLDSGNLDSKTLSREFDVFRVVPADRGRILVTGYYEPLLEGNLKPGGRFTWPIYSPPSDLITVDLDRFDPTRFHGERLVGRLEKKLIVPYFSRADIDGKKVLEHSGAQMAWLKDPVDSFFLHIQGSGVIKLPDGREVRVGYAGSNGRPYYSIGKTLIENGAIPREEMSLQAIRNYLQSHPEGRDKIMWENESYVFFRWVSEGPVGSLETILTKGRSAAVDPKIHPRGALAFLISEKPRYNIAGQVEGWDRISRWVLNQDAGGAIKGPGRIDLFCGTGDAAERMAGPMKQPGELYYFVKKGSIPAELK